jgi:hypothetical protein
MFDDGRLLVLLGLAGVAAAPAVRAVATGSRGVARASSLQDPSREPGLLRIVNDQGRPFRVRIVRKGDRHGLNDVLVFPDPKSRFEVDSAKAGDVLVEFYDASQDPKKFGPRGQFVSQYYLSTLRGGGSQRFGLSLHGGVPEWTVSAKNVQDAIAYAERS